MTSPRRRRPNKKINSLAKPCGFLRCPPRSPAKYTKHVKYKKRLLAPATNNIRKRSRDIVPSAANGPRARFAVTIAYRVARRACYVHAECAAEPARITRPCYGFLFNECTRRGLTSFLVIMHTRRACIAVRGEDNERARYRAASSAASLPISPDRAHPRPHDACSLPPLSGSRLSPGSRLRCRASMLYREEREREESRLPPESPRVTESCSPTGPAGEMRGGETVRIPIREICSMQIANPARGLFRHTI